MIDATHLAVHLAFETGLGAFNGLVAGVPNKKAITFNLIATTALSYGLSGVVEGSFYLLGGEKNLSSLSEKPISTLTASIGAVGATTLCAPIITIGALAAAIWCTEKFVGRITPLQVITLSALRAIELSATGRFF